MSSAAEKLRWPRWPEFLKAVPGFRIIGYGTLINRHSIEKTIDAAHLEGPAVAFGLRRVFSFLLADQNYVDHGGRYERSSDPRRCATLNLLPTGTSRDRVNGIMFSVAPADIDTLAEREFGYDLLPVEHNRKDINETAYVFIARKSSLVIGERVRDDILPNESSVRICLQGAATYGEKFLREWIDSCYLADGRRMTADTGYRKLVKQILAEISFGNLDV